MKRLLFVILILALVVPCYAGKVVDVDKLNLWIQANQRDEVIVPPPVPPPLPPPVPPPPVIGALGSKTNPYKMNVMYPDVSGGYVAEKKGKAFSIGTNAKVYLEVDPSILKPSANAFQMVIKGMNCPTLTIYKAYYNKITQTYTDDVYFTAKGTLNYVASSPSRPFSSTKFLYVLENGGALWTIECWVQMLN